MSETLPTRCGAVALLGAPNAGKSTLVNQLVGAKVAIVTHKVQTTRSRLRGIVIHNQSQLILVDTPGVFAPKRRLDRAMVEAAWAGASDADHVLFLVDATVDFSDGFPDPVERILSGLRDVKRPVSLVLNKVDLVKKDVLLGLIAALNERGTFSDTFMISALTGDGVDELRDHLAAIVPEGPWLFEEDDLTDAPLRMTAAEITREKLYLRLHQELPYASTVETTDWKTLKDGSVRIEQTIFVERESQRRIVLGHKGQAIKQISMEARKEISEVVGAKVHLFLFVKVREKWGDDPERYRELGLEFPSG